jgi:hypothetical protein
MAKNKIEGPSMAQKRAAVDRWLKSSFVAGGNISDKLYEISQGKFDSKMPFKGLDDPNSVLYAVDDICKALSTKGEIDELFNALTVLYAVKKSIGLSFDSTGNLIEHETTEDDTFNILFKATVAIKGSDYRFKDVCELYKIVSRLGRDEFLDFYPGFIEAVKNQCKALNGGTVALPKFFISKTIGDIVKKRCCKTVYNPFAGVGGLLLGLDSSMDYTGQEAYGVYSIFSRVIADAYDFNNASFHVGNPLVEWPDEQFDAVVFNLPTDCYFDDYDNYLYKSQDYDQLHEDVFNLLLEKHTARKTAIGLVRYPFIRSYEFKNLRRKLFDAGVLERVICLPEDDVFSDSKIKTVIIVLDFEKQHDSDVFYRGDYAVINNHSAYATTMSGGYNIIEETPEPFIKEVNGEILDYFDWKYISAIYANPIFCQNNEKPCFLSQVASIVPDNPPKKKSGFFVSSGCFSTRFFDVLNKRNKYEFQEIRCHEPSEVSGPCILFRVDTSGMIGACIVREGETVIYSTYNIYALKPNEEKVSLEYLAYSLVTSKEFAHYMRDCLEYNADDRVQERVLLFGRLAIDPDIGAQKQFINETLKKYIVTKNRTYNVIWASDFWSNNTDKGIIRMQERIQADVAKFGVRIISTPSTAVQLADSLSKHIDECISSADRADAVFLDAGIRYGQKEEEAYDGLDFSIELKDKYTSRKLPFYLYTNTSFEDISKAKIKARRLEYFRNRYFNATAPESLESLCLKFQDEMNALGSREAEMRSKYARVFHAADRYNEGNIQRVLTDALDEEFSNELSLKDTEDKFNKLRQIAEDLLKSLARKDILPDIKFGAQVDFLADGRFDDLQTTARFYHAEKRLMSNTLSLALRYFKQIVAGGSHKAFGDNLLDVVEYVSKESKNSDLYKSALYILMDVLLWYEQILDKAESDPDSVVGSFTSVPRGKPETGIVELDDDGSLICGHTRLNTNRQSTIKEGDTVIIRKSKVDTFHPTEKVWFFAQPDDYTVVPSAE